MAPAVSPAVAETGSFIISESESDRKTKRNRLE